MNLTEQFKSLNYKNFNINMTEFVNENKLNSQTNYLIVTSLQNKYTYIFQRKGDSWIQLYKWICTVGKQLTPTVKGMFKITGRKIGFGTELYSVKYATRIIGRYYYHSILYDKTGKYIIDGRLGMALSHGCIRLKVNNAKWIYENISDGTTVIIS